MDEDKPSDGPPYHRLHFFGVIVAHHNGSSAYSDRGHRFVCQRIQHRRLYHDCDHCAADIHGAANTGVLPRQLLCGVPQTVLYEPVHSLHRNHIVFDMATRVVSYAHPQPGLLAMFGVGDIFLFGEDDVPAVYFACRACHNRKTYSAIAVVDISSGCAQCVAVLRCAAVFRIQGGGILLFDRFLVPDNGAVHRRFPSAQFGTVVRQSVQIAAASGGVRHSGILKRADKPAVMDFQDSRHNILHIPVCGNIF